MLLLMILTFISSKIMSRFLGFHPRVCMVSPLEEGSIRSFLIPNRSQFEQKLVQILAGYL